MEALPVTDDEVHGNPSERSESGFGEEDMRTDGSHEAKSEDDEVDEREEKGKEKEKGRKKLPMEIIQSTIEQLLRSEESEEKCETSKLERMVKEKAEGFSPDIYGCVNFVQFIKLNFGDVFKIVPFREREKSPIIFYLMKKSAPISPISELLLETIVPCFFFA